jgi:hypothetical protein
MIESGLVIDKLQKIVGVLERVIPLERRRRINILMGPRTKAENPHELF